jgi:hypothetical protein
MSNTETLVLTKNPGCANCNEPLNLTLCVLCVCIREFSKGKLSKLIDFSNKIVFTDAYKKSKSSLINENIDPLKKNLKRRRS